MSNQVIPGKRYPVRLGRSMLNLPSAQKFQLISVTVREDEAETSNPSRLEAPADRDANSFPTVLQINLDDETVVELWQKDSQSIDDSNSNYPMIFRDDVLYLERCSAQYTVSKHDMDKLENSPGGRNLLSLGISNGRAVLASEQLLTRPNGEGEADGSGSEVGDDLDQASEASSHQSARSA